jgi:xylose isomerase
MLSSACDTQELTTINKQGGKHMDFTPKPEDKFTFGLWTVGNLGRDPFGEPVRKPLSPVELVHLLAEVGAYGVNFHDNDLVPIDATPAQRDLIVRDFKAALNETGLVVPMATTNLFTDPAFKDGAFTANDPAVRAYALQKTMRAIDLGVECGAGVYVFWGGREGAETDATKDPLESMKRFREALNFLCAYVRDQGYDLRFALEPKPNEPRGDIFLATVGHALGMIATLDHPEMVGVNPEVAHETMAGLNFLHGRRQAVPYRPERPGARALRPGLPLWRGQSEKRVLPGEVPRRGWLHRQPALRRARLPHREL